MNVGAIIAGILCGAFIIIALVLRNEKVNATTKEQIAKKIYYTSVFCVFSSIAITILSLLLILVFPGVSFFKWWFGEVVCWIFMAGFLMIPIGRFADVYIPEEKSKEQKT